MSWFLLVLEAAIATIANIWQAPTGTSVFDARTTNLMKKSENPEHYVSSDDAMQNSTRTQKTSKKWPPKIARFEKPNSRGTFF